MSRLATFVLFTTFASVGWPQTASDNAELKEIYEADQKDRQPQIGAIDWSQVAPRDVARRKRVRELMNQNQVATGADYERAAMVFQHGEGTDDFLLAHILAVTALGKGASSARWLATATLDRYLQRIGQPQVFGTQFTTRNESGKNVWTMEPYNRTLISPVVRQANCVPDFEDQAEMLKAIQNGETIKPPKRPPCGDGKK